MPIDLQCGQCRKRYRVGDALAGKKVKCKACGFVMSVPTEEELEGRGPVPLGEPGQSKPVSKPHGVKSAPPRCRGWTSKT